MKELNPNKPIELVNYNRVWYRVLHNWYLVVLSLLVALTITFIINRYTTKIYPLSANILYKESDEIGQTGELLYSNQFTNTYRNYYNEPYIIKSFPVLQRVVDSLGFTVSFLQEGNVLTSETYDVPIKVVGNKRGSEYLTDSYMFTILDEQSYTLKDININSEFSLKANFGDTIEVDGFTLTLTLKNQNFTRFIGDELIMLFSDGFSLARSYSNRLQVTWMEQGSGVVDLSIRGPIPRKESEFLSELISQLIEKDVQNKQEAARRSKEFIDEQLKIIADSLLLIELQLELFKDNNVQIGVDAATQRIILRIDQLEQNKTQYIVKKAYYNYLETYLANETKMDQIVLPSTIGITDPILTSLIQQLVVLQFDTKSIVRKSENPLTSIADKRITDLRDGILESVKNLRITDQIVIDQLDSEIRTNERQLAVLPKAERQLVSIQRSYSLGENLYVFLNQKRAEAAISEAATTSDIVLINPPILTGGYIAPNIGRNYTLAVTLGLITPLMLFIFFELINNKVQSREDLTNNTDIPILGFIGHNEDIGVQVVKQNPKSVIAESFRALRSNLTYLVQKDKYVLMVTSSLSGEGKTFTASNLSNIIALAGKKTLIIEADLRKPKIAADLGISSKAGLSSHLAGKDILDDIIFETGVENLWIIPGGPIPPNPAELLMRLDLNESLAKLKKQFDVIVIDTPPIAVVADAMAVSPLVDHTIFVTRQNYTPLAAIQGINEHFIKGTIKSISLIFNDVKTFGPGYGYSYGYGYGYGGYYGKYSSNDHGYYG